MRVNGTLRVCLPPVAAPVPAKIHEVFNQLVTDKQVKIKTTTVTAHDLLRTRLCKLFSHHKDTLEAIGFSDSSSSLSVCASFDADSGVSTYRLQLRKHSKEVTYEIVE